MLVSEGQLHARCLIVSYLERSEVDNAVNVGVGLEDLVEALLVSDIELNELGLLAGDQLNAVQGLGGGVVQVVGHDNLVPSLEQGEGGERANVARATADMVSWDLNDRWETTYPATRTEPADMMEFHKLEELGRGRGRGRGSAFKGKFQVGGGTATRITRSAISTIGTLLRPWTRDAMQILLEATVILHWN